MGNINLLPQDLRKKEEKELTKLAKKPRVLEVAFSSGTKPAASPIKDEKKGPSLWARIFGKRERKNVAVKNEIGMFTGGAESVDILAAAKKQNMNLKVGSNGKLAPLKEGKIVATKASGSSQVIAATPVASAPVKKEVKKTTEVIAVKKDDSFKLRWPAFQTKKFSPQEGIKPVAAAQSVVPAPTSFDASKSKVQIREKQARDSWWLIFKSLFVRQKKVVMPQVSEKVEQEKSSTKPSKFSTAPKRDKSRFSINLIPEELANKKQIGRDMQIVSMILAITLPSLIIYGLYIILDAYQTKLDTEIQAKQNEIVQLNASLSNYKKAKQKNIDLQQKLLVIRDLIDKHVYWTRFFGLLEKYTLDGVYYTNFSLDTGGEFVLPATANNYEEVAKQIIVFRQAKDFIADVKVDAVSLKSSGAAGITGVDFNIKIKLTDTAFKAVKK